MTVGVPLPCKGDGRMSIRFLYLGEIIAGFSL